uniref:Uncharacterized protein n=1 Tax=Rhizophora mucronata TaxID=61149 RepID=A0A2P2IUE0_RHIMU
MTNTSEVFDGFLEIYTCRGPLVVVVLVTLSCDNWQLFFEERLGKEWSTIFAWMR